MDSKSIDKSASALGKARAVRTIPDIPEDCRVKERHVSVTVDADPWSLLVKEGARLDAQNARTDRCNGTGGFYDRMKATQEAATR